MNDNKPPLLILIPLILMGIISLVFGIINVYNTNEKTKDYIIIDGKFEQSSVYSKDSDGITYRLTYSYVVNNKEYYISTDYGTSIVPKLGSEKTIKYNPYDPKEAIFTGLGVNAIFLLGGLLLCGVPLMIILRSAILLGILFTSIGSLTYYIMCPSTNSLSLIEAFKTNGAWVLIPIIFVIVGIYIAVSALFMKKNKTITVEVKKIEHISLEGKFRIIFGDEKVSNSYITAITRKYLIYETKSKDKFIEGKKYKINLYKYGIMFEYETIDDTIQAWVLKSFCDEDFIEVVNNEKE